MVNRQLYILRGIPGIGKSTWVKQNNLTEYTISSDELRLQYPMTTLPDGRKVITQLFDEQVWKELYNILEKRMLRGDKVIIIDATHNKLRYITKYEYLAYQYKYDINIVEFSNDIELAKEQNKKREGYKYVPEKVIDDMAARITSSEKELRDRYKTLTANAAKFHIMDVLAHKKVELEDLFDYVNDSVEIDYVNHMFDYIPAVKLLKNFDQRNRWHAHNLEDHTNFVANEILYYRDEIVNRNSERIFYLLFLASIFHDIGKPWAAVEDREGNKELHFPDHPKISAEIWKTMVAPHINISQDEMQLVYDLILQHDMEVDKMKDNYLLLQLKRADALNHRNVNKNEMEKIYNYIEGDNKDE